MRVICYGDSNTYGYDPRSFFGGRYPAGGRWTDILAAQTGWNVENAGENGRDIPRRALSVSADTDLLIIMLGSNDLLQGHDISVVAARMETFLKQIAIEKGKVLLIAPPPMQLGAWVSGRGLIESSVQLAQSYRSLAARMGVRFADAGVWNIELTFDGVHFTEKGHRSFAAGLYQFLKEGE